MSDNNIASWEEIFIWKSNCLDKKWNWFCWIIILPVIKSQFTQMYATQPTNQSSSMISPIITHCIMQQSSDQKSKKLRFYSKLRREARCRSDIPKNKDQQIRRLRVGTLPDSKPLVYAFIPPFCHWEMDGLNQETKSSTYLYYCTPT